MRFGFYLPNSGPTAQPEPLAAIARRGDELGFHCMVAGDHILVPREVNSTYPYTADGRFHGGNAAEYMEQLTLLTFLAGITRNIRLVPSVMIVPLPEPAAGRQNPGDAGRAVPGPSNPGRRRGLDGRGV